MTSNICAGSLTQYHHMCIINISIFHFLISQYHQYCLYSVTPRPDAHVFYCCAYKSLEFRVEMIKMVNYLCRSASCASEFEDPSASWWTEEGSVHAAGSSPGVPANRRRGGGGRPSVCHLSYRMPSVGERPDSAFPKQAQQSQQMLTKERKPECVFC